MESSVLVAGAACLLGILLVKWMFGGKKTPPGPWNLPIVGYLPFLSSMPYLDLQKLAKKYGNIFSIRLGSSEVVVLSDFNSTKEALSQDAYIGRPPDSPFAFSKETVETGAFNSLPWKKQRGFALHMLRDLGFGKTKMEGQLHEEMEELLEYFEKNVDQPFLMRERLTSSMSNNIGSLVFGKRLPYEHPDRQMLNEIFIGLSTESAQIIWQIFFPWLAKVVKALGLIDVSKHDKLQEDLKIHFRKEIKEHEDTLNPNNIRDFIDAYLMEIRKRGTEEPAFCRAVLEDLTGAFFGAGSETVRVSVEWLTLAAATHQDYQRRIQAEIDEVIGRNRLPEMPDQKSMPFTEAYIYEMLRWRSIIPLNLMHYTITDAQLGEYFIPKGTQVLVNIWAIHHNKDYWGSDADIFRPERFLTEDGKSVKKWEHFIPFAIGKRQCPGEPLARVEVFLYFAAILQRFNVRMPDGKVADFDGVLGAGLSSKPQELIFSKRD